jgi:hypothetical protein
MKIAALLINWSQTTMNYLLVVCFVWFYYFGDVALSTCYQWPLQIIFKLGAAPRYRVRDFPTHESPIHACPKHESYIHTRPKHESYIHTRPKNESLIHARVSFKGIEFDSC